MSTSSSTEPLSGSFKYTRRYKPKCELAELIVIEMSEQHFRAPQIIKAMGYPPKHRIAAMDRLRYVLCSANLGLDGSYIDAYYGAKGFVSTLCELLGIDKPYYKQQIDDIIGEI